MGSTYAATGCEDTTARLEGGMTLGARNRSSVGLAGLAAAGLPAPAGVVTTERGGAGAGVAPGTRAESCPAGYVRTSERGGGCVLRAGPEAPGELMTARAQLSARSTAPFTSVAPGALGSAMAERDAVGARSA